MRWVILAACGALLFAGCGTMRNTVRQRAENDLGCSEVEVENVGGQSFSASGCGRTATYTCVRSATWGVACEHDDASRSSAAPAQTSVSSPSGRLPPPTGAGGFSFGATAADTKSTCESAGHVYTTTGGEGSCDGLATDVGAPGSAAFRLCQGKVCGVSLSLERNGETLEQSVLRWTRAVSEKYGRQTETRNTVASGCTDLAACVVAGNATVSVLWSWPSGEAIELRVPRGGVADALRVELAYRARLAASGL